MPYLILTLGIGVLYGNTLSHSFHYDDFPSILEKPWIRGLDKIPTFITNYSIRPVVIFTYNLNYTLSEFEVWSYHLFNISIHLAVVLLIYLFTKLMIDFLHRAQPSFPWTWKNVPFIASIIFAIHPLNTQAVTYISGRSSLMATLFFLATCILFFKGFQNRPQSKKYCSLNPSKLKSTLYFISAMICLILGGLSKIIVITLPAILFLCHFYFYSGKTFRNWITTAYVPILLIAMPMATFIAYRLFSKGGILPTGPTEFSASTYFLTQTFVIPFEYFWKMLFPINQSIEVHYPIISDWSLLTSYIGLATLGIIVLIIFWLSSFSRLAGFGLAWMLITILPTSSFVPLLDVAVEHRTYLPLAGFSIFFATTIDGLIQLFKNSASKLKLAYGCCGIIGICMAALLVHRNAVWKDDVSLWTDAKSKAPNLVRVYNNLGEAYDKQNQYPEAIKEFQTALQMDPNYVFALNNLGNIYGKMKHYNKAIPYFQKVISIKERYAPAHYNLARAFQSTNQNDKALIHYRKAIDIIPHFEQAIYNYALLGIQMKKPEIGIEYFYKFIELQPNNVRGYFGLGNVYAYSNQFDQAIEIFKKGIEADPNYLLTYVNLATAQMQSGKIEDAIKTYQQILKKNPGIAGVHKNLGLIYAQHQPNIQKAIFHFEKSLDLDPQQPEAPIIQNVLLEMKNQPQQ